MRHKIKTITFNGKTIASKDNALIKRVIFNGVVIWPPSLTGELSSAIKRVVYNGEQIWPQSSDPLVIEKSHISLDWTNNYTDTNQVTTDLAFTVE